MKQLCVREIIEVTLTIVIPLVGSLKCVVTCGDRPQLSPFMFNITITPYNKFTKIPINKLPLTLGYRRWGWRERFKL